MRLYFGKSHYGIAGQQVTFKDSMLANKSRANIRWWIWLIVAIGGIIITLLYLLCYAKLKNYTAKGNLWPYYI